MSVCTELFKKLIEATMLDNKAVSNFHSLVLFTNYPLVKSPVATSRRDKCKQGKTDSG